MLCSPSGPACEASAGQHTGRAGPWGQAASLNSAVQGGRTCFCPAQLCLESSTGCMVSNSMGGVLGVAVFGNEHSHERGVCTAWAPHVPAGEREAVTALYQENREQCQHGQWVSSADTAQVKLNQRKGETAMSRGLPCGTPLALYHEPRELRTAPLNKHHHPQH